MKIVFVARGIENIGVEYLAAALKQEGHSAFLVFDPSLFNNFYFLNKTLANFFNYNDIIIDEIANIKPDLVAFSVLSDDLSWALSLAGRLKKHIRVPVIFGGIHPTSVPELVIKEDPVDFVCIGEGEKPLLELADSIMRGADETCIKNIWAKKDGKIIENPIGELNEDLDSLPFPEKDIYYKKYPVFYDQAYKILTARGCPHVCSYCYNSYFRKIFHGKGKYLRRRSADNVISELVIAKNKYKIKRVAFLDDTFIYDHSWLNDFLTKYKENIRLPFMCTVHPSLTNKKVVRLLKDAGCTVVNMGIQDLNENLRREVLNRNDSNGDIRRSIKLIKKSKIFMYTTVILGLPKQGEKEVIEIVGFLNNNRPDVPDSNWLRYYPKTSITDFSFKHGLLQTDDVDRINKSYGFHPYGLGGDTFNKKLLKFRNLLFLTCILPKKLIAKIIEEKIYNLMPPVDLRTPILAIVFFKNSIYNNRKYIYPVFTISNIISFNLYFISKKVKIRISRILNKR